MSSCRGERQCDDRSRELVIGRFVPNPYSVLVMKTSRCLLAALLLLVFGGGMVFAASQSGDLIEPAIEASVDQSMPGCNECGGGDKAMTTASCAGLGTCMQAVDCLTASSLPEPDSVIHPSIAQHIAGFAGSPEPFPPKVFNLA